MICDLELLSIVYIYSFRVTKQEIKLHLFLFYGLHISLLTLISANMLWSFTYLHGGSSDAVIMHYKLYLLYLFGMPVFMHKW